MSWNYFHWLLSAVGKAFTWITHRSLNQQKHELGKLKTKFDYAISKKNKIVSVLNRRISDIELWRNRLLELDGPDDIDVPYFHQLLHKFEDAYTYGRYLLSPELCGALEDLLGILKHCYEVWQNEDRPYIKPEDSFANAIFGLNIADKFKGAKWRLQQEIASE